MVRKKIDKGVPPGGEISATDEAPPSVPSEDEAPQSSHAASKLRLVSVLQCATLLGRNRTTVDKWLANGCPFVTKADKDRGQKWELDLSDVVRWLEQRASECTAEKLGKTTDGAVSEGEAKRRRAVALMYLDEAEASDVLRSYVRWKVTVDAVEALLGEVRGAVALIPDAIAGRLDPKYAPTARKVADDAVRKILKSLRTDAVVSKRPPGE